MRIVSCEAMASACWYWLLVLLPGRTVTNSLAVGESGSGSGMGPQERVVCGEFQYLNTTSNTCINIVCREFQYVNTTTKSCTDIVCGEHQYLNTTTKACINLPADFSIIYNQTGYSITLNEFTAVPRAPLVHFTVFAIGSLFKQSFTKTLATVLSGSTSYFSLDSARHELSLTLTIEDHIPGVVVNSGTIWVSPIINTYPPPQIYSLTLMTHILIGTPVNHEPVIQSTNVTITLLETDPCEDRPCANGQCSKTGVISFTCTCPPNFTGPICDIPYDPCDSAPCDNGATCSLGPAGFTCACPTGFTGHTCSIDIDECDGANCGNGTCQDLVGEFTCVCLTGYTGLNCEINIDDCASNPCVNGQCRDLVAAFYCECNAEKTVTHCGMDQVVSATPQTLTSSLATPSLAAPSAAASSLTTPTQSPLPPLHVTSNCIVINLALTVALAVTLTALIVLVITTISLAWRLRAKSRVASIAPAAGSSLVIDSMLRGNEEKDAYIEMFEEML